MRMSRLITLNWGTIDHRDWPLADATLLTGESGSGKSTLLDAMQAVLTAARQGVFHFNAGQNESTQSRRGGKEPRTLAAYALGQCGGDVFLRTRCTSYVGLVFEPSEGESAQGFTALLGMDAHVDAARADGGRPMFYLVRAAVSIEHLLATANSASAPRPLGLKEVLPQLQLRLGLTPDQISRYEGKDSYLQHLYGFLMGKKFVPEADATRCARAIVKAMAYREIGNVNDLVRDEILDEKDFSQEVGKLRQLMQEIARLKADAERLKLNIDRLKLVDDAASDVIALLRKHVIALNAHALRLQRECTAERLSVFNHQQRLLKQAGESQGRLDAIGLQRQRLDSELAEVQGELNLSTVNQAKQALDARAAHLAQQFHKEWSRVQQAARQMDEVLTHVTQLLALDVSALPDLREAVTRLHPAAQQAHKLWAPARGPLTSAARLDDELAAFELEPLDQALKALESVLSGADASVMNALINARSQLLQQQRLLKDEQDALRAELKLLLSGRSPAPTDVQQALTLLDDELPQARAKMLAALIEPKPGSTWQSSIEGYMGRDRFAIIVEPEHEEDAIKLIKHHFARRSPKIVQGSKAIDDTRDASLPPQAILHELVCQHPVANAYLLALYRRVVKVGTEAELRKTPQGLMQQGLGSRAYGMFACLASEHELTFGLASRQKRLAWVSRRLDALVPELTQLTNLDRSLRMVMGWFQRLGADSLSQALGEALSTRLLHVEVVLDLSRLDTSSIDGLTARKAGLQEALEDCAKQWDDEQRKVGVQDKDLAQATKRLADLDARRPTLDQEVTNASVWFSRFAAVASGITSEVQLQTEAQELGDTDEPTTSTLSNWVNNTADNLPDRLKTLRNHIGTYLAGARTDDERFTWNEPPRVVDQMEAVLQSVQGVQHTARDQVRRQDSIGLADNVARLEKAEASFNHVFTSDFCFQVRRDVKDGSATLRKLSSELKAIQFGVDTYDVVQDWVPRFKAFYDFFEALDTVVDQLDKDKGAIFDAPQLSEAHRATAQEIKRLLLSQDQIAAERALKELADYRNYRRYDIHRIVGGHATPLSTWGTGSGGELETPFYVIRAAVLAHALGHFGRDAKAPALRMMLSDEAFSKMDESRSRAVLRFLSQNMGLQLIVAMPTSKSGAIKPEFDKEYTFSKLEAQANGQTVYLSEVQEKDFKRHAMAQLWADHAQTAREQARQAFEAKP
ncbi:ATP-binding protein [Aquabacterium parvum]|uniref:ATP-binding protein n=1 Tax=Aquabacterium parvum TaxID=70584 RepID=UPI0009FA3D58|nr:ATP-binding protein [Aquabacterium parvum]MBU0914956.1 ArsR family transcriptional regulator [Gammaproteobacteria bacterium]